MKSRATARFWKLYAAALRCPNWARRWTSRGIDGEGYVMPLPIGDKPAGDSRIARIDKAAAIAEVPGIDTTLEKVKRVAIS